MSAETKTKRPGLVTFTAIMLFVVAGMHVVTAIEELTGGKALQDVSFGLFSGDLAIWGIVDLIIVAVIVFAGIDILRGGSFGRWFGIIFASISAIRSFWFVYWAPVAAFTVIALDIFIIYELIMNEEYFDRE